MKKYALTGLAAMAMSAAVSAAPVTKASDGFYGYGIAMPVEASPTAQAVVSLSGACSGSFTVNSALGAALWKVKGADTAIDPSKTMIGAVNIFQYSVGEEITQFAVMAGNFGGKFSTSVTRNSKGETIKVTAETEILAKDLYNLILSNKNKVNCAAGSFENVVAKYPEIGPEFQDFMPFEQGAPEYKQKAGKVTFQLTNNDAMADGQVTRSGTATYKQTVTVTGAFPTTSVCKLKGTLDAPASMSCVPGKPINVKVSMKAQGAMESDETVIGLLFPEYFPEE